LIAAVNAGSSSGCGTIINGVMQPCDTADFNRDGEVNGDDITAFIAAKQGTYYVPAGDIGEYRFLYRGYWYDPHLHIYHVRHRAYDPEIQRWLQPDPAYFVDGLNRYAYCGNEPVHLYDPMGLWAWDDDWVETIIDVVTQREVAKNFVQGAGDGFLVTTNAAVQVVTVGMAGYSQQQLDAMGMLYDAENPQLAASRYAGYTAGGALLAASLVSGISSTTGATMEVHLGFMRNGKFHMMYSSQGVYAHAFGRAGGSYIVTSRAVESAFVGRSLTLAGIPIRNSAAAMMTGGSAYSCVTAAGKAFVRGWRKLP
jgi:RHS repeat-associated protein